jgi:hypothetical protein
MFHNLWNLRRIPKCVWQPKLFGEKPKFLTIKSLPIKELSDETFTTAMKLQGYFI